MVSLAVMAYGEGGVTAVGVVTAARMATAALLAPFLATLADRVRRERVLTCDRGGPRRDARVCRGRDGVRRPRGRDVRVRDRRDGRRGALPAGAFGPAPLPRQVPGGPDERERGARDAGLALHPRRSGGRGRAPRCERAGHRLRRVRSGVPAGEDWSSWPSPTTSRRGRPPGADRPRRDVLQGFATIAGDRTLSLVTALGVVQTLTRGCLTVFTVVLAIDLLDTGDPGVGILNAAVGAGGVLGSLFAFTLVRRGGLAPGSGSGSRCSARRSRSSAPSRSRWRRSCCSASSASATR